MKKMNESKTKYEVRDVLKDNISKKELVGATYGGCHFAQFLTDHVLWPPEQELCYFFQLFSDTFPTTALPIAVLND